MTLDLLVLGLVLLSAIWGAFTGAARQIAQYVALVIGGIAAAPGGHFFAQPVAARMGTSLGLGVIIATVLTFIVVFVTVRLIVRVVVKRLITGQKEEGRGRDRALGFLLAGVRMTVFAYLALCVLAFVENNVVVAGKKLGFTPKDSVIFPFVRSNNLLEYQQFSGSRDLLKLAKTATSPGEAAALARDSDFAALMNDPRFKKLISTDAMKKALQTGDVRAMFESNAIVEALQDDTMMRKIERAAEINKK